MIINFFLLFTGASTFPGLRKFIADRSKTRVLALLHIAAHGLASAGCTGWGTASIHLNFYSKNSLQALIMLCLCVGYTGLSLIVLFKKISMPLL